MGTLSPESVPVYVSLEVILSDANDLVVNLLIIRACKQARAYLNSHISRLESLIPSRTADAAR